MVGKFAAGMKAKIVAKEKEKEEALAAAAKDGPRVGEKVRVITEFAGKLRFGLHGQVVAHCVDSGTLRLHVDKGLPCSRDLTIAESFVATADGFLPFKSGLTLRSLRRSDMQTWLFEHGFGTKQNLDLRQFTDELAGWKPVSLAACHISMFWRLLKWALGAHTTCSFLHPELSAAWRASKNESEIVPEAAITLSKQENLLKHLWDTAKLFLCPIWSPGSGGHWTLLALERAASGAVEVRYYEFLKEDEPDNRLHASMVLKLLLGSDAELPQRCNSSSQSQQACGFCVCWYIEEETRHHNGEGWGGRGWLCEKQVRDKLHSIMKVLDAEDFKMRKQEEQRDNRVELAKAKAKRQEGFQDAEAKIKAIAQEKALEAAKDFEAGDHELPSLLEFKGPEVKAVEPHAEKKKTEHIVDPCKAGDKEGDADLSKQGAEEKKGANLRKHLSFLDGEHEEVKKCDLKEESSEQKKDAEKPTLPAKGSPEYDQMKNAAIERIATLKGQREQFEAWASKSAEILPEEDKSQCKYVKEAGFGICGRCNWSSGCRHCDWAKAVRYFFNKHVKGTDIPECRWARIGHA